MLSVCKSVWTLNVLKSVYWVIYILRFTMSKAHEDRLVKQTSNFINNLILWLAYTVTLGLWVLKAHLHLQKRIFSFRSSFPGDKQLPFALTVSLLITSLTIHNVDSWILSPLPCRIHSCWIFSVLYWHKTLVEVEKKKLSFPLLCTYTPRKKCSRRLRISDHRFSGFLFCKHSCSCTASLEMIHLE